YATALGGTNLIEFLPRGGGVRVHPVVATPNTMATLHRSLLLFYTGRQRSAGDVLSKQGEGIRAGRSIEALQRMRDLAYEMRDCIGAADVDAVGRLLHENWQLKRG